MTAPVFFLIAGEASGDVLGARLMQALRDRFGAATSFRGIGGPQMLAEGLSPLFPYTELMHFGVVEVLRHIPRLLRRIGEAARDVIAIQPDALICIDAPDFSFRVARKVRRWSMWTRLAARNAALPAPLLVHYVAPTVWAWRPGRALKIAQFLDLLLTVLPFEPPYFTRAGLPAAFVGHSIIESGAGRGDGAALRARLGISATTPVLALLPGSRSGEIARLLPIFRATLALLKPHFPSLHIVLPAVPHLHDRIVAETAGWDVPVHVVSGETAKYDAMAAADAALACSGTVALELALARLPAVIAYRVNGLTATLYRRFIRVRFANLVNIMHDREAVPEFIQERCAPDNLAKAVAALLADPAARAAQIADLDATAAWLGRGAFIPSVRAADAIAEALAERAKPMVLQVIPALVTGGVERGTVETTAALTAGSFRALVASSGGPMAAEVSAAGGTHVPLPLHSKNPLIIWRNVARLRQTIVRHGVALIHARSRAPAWSAFYAARSLRVPFVTTFHSAYGAGSWLKRRYNAVMARGTRVIAISNFVAAYIRQHYGVGEDRLRVIPRGVALDQFDPATVSAERIAALRDGWGLTDDRPVILMPGRLTRWKGQLLLIDALAALPDPNWVCVIVGGGSPAFRDEILRSIDRAGLNGHVSVQDTCRDMPAAYRLAGVTVTPSLRPEGFGRTAIEAQAMGTPVVAARHGGAMECVVDGQTGYLFDPGDAAGLCRALQTALSLGAEARSAMAARAIAHIRADFTTARMTSRTLAVYREVLPTDG